jgi:hypothetical protein
LFPDEKTEYPGCKGEKIQKVVEASGGFSADFS